ncbi:carbohydrate ABC transporter permease [Planosporangium sp. 12N6]|uniref:carbohydrate ABC transporter permease n=1 Tax=Planosporangium spinosum TaxID=3402278 RepID=UPI003CF17F6A
MQFGESGQPVAARTITRPNYVAGVLSAFWLVIIGMPVLWMISWSLQRRSEYLVHGPLALPSRVTFENFRAVVEGGFASYLLNSAAVALASVALTLVLALPAAYAIVRSRSWLSGAVFRVFLLGLAIPAQATIIPVYWILTRLELYDTLTGIVLPTVAFGLPLVILILAGSLRDVPGELYEAMTVDGAGPLRAFVRLTLPLSRGAITTVAIFSGLNAWNGFIFPLILTQSKEKRVATLGLWDFQQQYGVDVPRQMTAVLLSTIPVLFLYLFARRWLVAGLAGMGGK